MRLEYFQMVDRIAELDPAARTVRAECLVPEASPVFEGHFPGHPLLPGALMIETIAQTGGWLVLAVLRFQRMPFLAQVIRSAELGATGQTRAIAMIDMQTARLHMTFGALLVAGILLSGIVRA